MIKRLKAYEPQYEKTGTEIIKKIASEKMEDAIANGQWALRALFNNGLLMKTEHRREVYRQLYISGSTFSTIFETLVDLKKIQKR